MRQRVVRWRDPNKPKRGHPEQDFQKTLAAYLDWCLIPPVEYSAIGHGIPLTQHQANTLKAMGLKPGLGDIEVFGPERFILWLECKARNGVASGDQKAFRARVLLLGHHYAIVKTIEDARIALLSYGVPLRDSKPDHVMDGLRQSLAAQEARDTPRG